MTTTAPPAAGIRWRVPIVQCSTTGSDRSETSVEVVAPDQRAAWNLAQELPDAPAESDTCAYGTPVRIRGDR